MQEEEEDEEEEGKRRRGKKSPLSPFRFLSMEKKTFSHRMATVSSLASIAPEPSVSKRSKASL